MAIPVPTVAFPSPAAAPPGPALAVAGRALERGTTLDDGRYRLGAPLGRGGFGITYAAVDERLRRPVAVKELFPDGAHRGDDGRVVVPPEMAPRFVRARERFLREATTLARFGHPNIVRIFATLEERATAYLVLERLDGRTLSAELRTRGGPFTEAEGLDVAAQAAAALAVVHRAGILHRDVTPSNLVRTTDGRLVLIDFGLARRFVEDHTTSMTRIATPGYAPPEQHQGSARFSARADVYALGATLYRLLSARHPPPADRRGSRALAPLWRVNPTVSRRTSDAVAAALSINPADRPPSVEAWLESLGTSVEGRGLDDADAAVVDLRDHPAEDPAEDPADRVTVVVPDAQVVPVAPEAPVAIEAPDAVATEVARTDALDEVETEVASEVAAQWVVPAPVDGPDRDRRRRSAAPVHAAVAGARPDLPLGTAPLGRAWVTVPLGLALVALTSAQPITIVALAGLLVAPALATVGDVVARPHRTRAWIPAWMARNVAVGAVRVLGPAVVLVTGVGLWYGADAFEAVAPAAPWILRVTGVVAGWLLAVSISRGGSGFRSHLALDALAHRIVPGGRPTAPSIALAVVCTLVVLAGVAFQPEAWPIR